MGKRVWFAVALLLPVGAALMVSTDSQWIGLVLSIGLWILLAAGFAVRIIRSARPGSTTRRALAPAADAGEDVQTILLGRPPRTPVTYGRDEPIVPTLVDVDFHDPLNESAWTISAPKRRDEHDHPPSRGPEAHDS